MITPNGRFQVNKRICMSMSDYHPESWNPTWNVQTIIIGLVSFMCTDERTAGCIISTDQEKRVLAKNSLDFCLKQPKFVELFKNQYSDVGITRILQSQAPDQKVNVKDQQSILNDLKKTLKEEEKVDQKQKKEVARNVPKKVGQKVPEKSTDSLVLFLGVLGLFLAFGVAYQLQ